MIMKMTNATIMEILNTLNKFDNCDGKLSYAIHKAKRKLLPEFKDFEEYRNELIKKYGEKDDNEVYTIEPGTDGYKKYLDEIIPISQEIVEVDIYQITQEEFDKSNYYNEKAFTKDYDLIETLFVKKDENNGDE